MNEDPHPHPRPPLEGEGIFAPRLTDTLPFKGRARVGMGDTTKLKKQQKIKLI
jgi:hypothetical protein